MAEREDQVHVSPALPDGDGGRFRAVFRALQSRNFRLFFGGQSVSLIGTWMTRVATSWLIYRLTGSVLLLGVVGFASQAPSFFLSPLAGVLIDRWNRRRLLIITQVLAMLQSLTLAALTLTDAVTITHILILSILQGVINAFDMPARHSFLVYMVDRKEDLSNAIALNSSMFNGARLVGPSLAGMMIPVIGEGYCFLFDGVSFVGVILALLAMHVRPQARESTPRPVLQELLEGFRYVASFEPIAYILILIAMVSFVGMPYAVLLPALVSELLGGGANTFGFLMAASGLGALIGAFYMATRRSVLGLGRLIPLSAAVFGLSLMAVSLSRFVWLSLVLMVVAGLSMMIQLASCNTVLQTIVDESKRGRIMSFYAMALVGTVPFGSLLAGAVANWIGTPRTLMASSACCIVGALWFARNLSLIREKIRPIYVRLGILPEIAADLQDATDASSPDETARIR